MLNKLWGVLDEKLLYERAHEGKQNIPSWLQYGYSCRGSY
jgi:hypothetical protein